jgi:hypothetical protein
MDLRRVWTAAAGIAAVAATAVAASAAPLPLSDPMCPRAVPRLAAFNEAAQSNDISRIAAAARSAADIYEQCAADARAQTGRFLSVEPYVNYETTREAQFRVVEARALIANGDLAGGLRAMRDARRLADYVATWQPESMSWDSTNHSTMQNDPVIRFSDASGVQHSMSFASHVPDHDGSRYQTAALEIRAAADQLLGRIQALHLPTK